jgi:hypothetical protein
LQALCKPSSSCNERFFEKKNTPDEGLLTSMQTMTSRRTPTIYAVNAVTRCRLLVGFIAAMAAFTAQAAEPQTMTLTMEAHKGYFSEQCFKLTDGQQLAYELSTRHPIDFNVHHHPDHGDTVFPDRLVVKSQHSKQIVAQSAGAYCFMATNLSDQAGAFDVVINYEITAQ